MQSKEKRLMRLEERVILPIKGDQTESKASERRSKMGLFKRGQVWWMDFIYKGKRYRESTETSNAKLAQRIYDKIKGQIAEGKWFERQPEGDKTFKEMITKYLEEYSARNKAPKTHIRDKSLASHLEDHFGSLSLAEVTLKLIAEYKTQRRKEGAAPKTVNLELALMNHAFNLAIREWEWCRENPASKVSKEKINNLIERWLSFQEEEELMSHCPKWLQEILLLGIETGLRQSELLNLQWSQVDLFRKTITILEQKNKGNDTLPLSQKALEVLKGRAKVRHINSNSVFYNGNGNKIDARDLLRAYYSAVKKAKLFHLRWHDATRHTFATRLVQGGADIYTVQKLGRWKNISMVMRYAHHYPESLRSAVEVLDRQRSDYVTNLSQSKEKGVTTISQPLDLIGSGG